MADIKSIFTKNFIEEIDAVGAPAARQAAESARAAGKNSAERAQAAYDAYWSAVGIGHPLDQFYDPYNGVYWDPTIDPETGIQTLGPTDSRDRFGNVPSIPTITERYLSGPFFEKNTQLVNPTLMEHINPVDPWGMPGGPVPNGTPTNADLAAMTFDDFAANLSTEEFEDEWNAGAITDPNAAAAYVENLGGGAPASAPSADSFDYGIDDIFGSTNPAAAPGSPSSPGSFFGISDSDPGALMGSSGEDNLSAPAAGPAISAAQVTEALASKLARTNQKLFC